MCWGTERSKSACDGPWTPRKPRPSQLHARSRQVRDAQGRGSQHSQASLSRELACDRRRHAPHSPASSEAATEPPRRPACVQGGRCADLRGLQSSSTSHPRPEQSHKHPSVSHRDLGLSHHFASVRPIFKENEPIVLHG